MVNLVSSSSNMHLMGSGMVGLLGLSKTLDVIWLIEVLVI